MTRTTELLKEIGTLSKCSTKDPNWNEIHNDMIIIKSELRGRLDALKEEREFLKRSNNFDRGLELQAINGKNRGRCFRIPDIFAELGIPKRIASIQEEIKLIESAGVGK